MKTWPSLPAQPLCSPWAADHVQGEGSARNKKYASTRWAQMSSRGKEIRAWGQALYAGKIMNHWKRGLAYAPYCLAALAMIGWEAWKKHKLCISLVSITSGCAHTDSDTEWQCRTVGPHPACSCQTSLLAERMASCQTDKPSGGSGPPHKRSLRVSASWMGWSPALWLQ